MGCLRTSALTALLLLGWAASARAQQVSGQVLDERSGEILSSVNVTLLDAAGRSVAMTRTDAQGAFALSVPSEGAYRLRAEGVEYGPLNTELVQVGGRVSLRLVMRLPMREVKLDALNVVAARRSASAVRLEGTGFVSRRHTNAGLFLTREEIERQNPMEMTAVVRMLPGVILVPSDPAAQGGDVVMRGSSCLPSVWVDGAMVRPGGYRTPDQHRVRKPTLYHTVSFWMSFDELVDPDEVEGLEVYRSALEVPAVFAGANPTCGALVVWRRPVGTEDELREAMARP